MGFLDSLKKLFSGGDKPAEPVADQPQEQAGEPQAEAAPEEAPAETEEKQESSGV